MRQLVFILIAVTTIAEAAPVHLRTNALDSPLGIDTPRPTFSWQSDAKTSNWVQSAYEILIASDLKRLQPGAADVWDSGRIASSDSVNITYAGSALLPQQRYFWAVRTWDGNGGQATSRPAWFETSLRADTDWKAQWITRDDPAAQKEVKDIRWIWLPGSDAMHVPSNSPAQFMYRLHLDQAPTAASLHVLVRGKFIAHVNGHVTGRHDDWGAFDREEIASLLRAGDNEVEIDVISHDPGKSATSAPSSAAASIHITNGKGREERIVSDGSWQARSTAESSWKPAQVVGALPEPFGTGPDRQTAIPGPDRIATDASLLRRSFTVGRNVRSARLTITALGAYQAFINERAVAPNNLLSPGWTDFHKRVLYQTYDVTSLLSKGANTIGVLLGGGWYSSPMTWSGFRYTPGPNLLRAQLDLTLADGTRRTIVTDPSWMCAPAPITFSEIYGGESYDDRLAQRGWTGASFNASGWTAAVSRAPASSGAILTSQPDLPISTVITVHPVHVAPQASDNSAVYDMGQNMVGNVRIHVHGPRGAVVRLRYAERLNPDGSIYTENLRNADATDTYALSGQGEETWTPAFTFHGFRYVEFSYIGPSPPDRPGLQTLEGLAYNSLPATPSIRLASSSQTLNKMNELGIWGQRGNFVSIPTDCPQRDERLGWMGDAGAFWRTGSYNFDIDAFTHKFMLDVTDAQTSAGAFTDVAPNILGPEPGAPGWGDAGIFIPYAAWLQYADTTLVERSWPAMERWMNFILQSNPDYLRRNALGNNYGDWLAVDANTPKDLIGTAYWAMAAREMVEMATALHRPGDAGKYQQLYEHIASAYRTAYVKPDGSVAGSTQTAYLATIFTGIVPESLRSNMLGRLVKDVEAHDIHLTTGFLGTPLLMFVLDENGRSDLAFKLLLSETYPSWGYMVKKGATTWWERWNGDTGDPSMNSYNHYAFGSVMAWVYRRAAGIDTDPMDPGYHHLNVRPHFDAALPQLHVEYDSAYGTVISDWQGSAHRFTVTIPANTSATVILPEDRTEKMGSGTRTFTIN